LAKFSDTKLELQDTIRVEYGDGIFVVIRPMPNPDFDAFIAKEQRSGRKGFRQVKASELDDSDVIKKAIAYTVLVDIQGAEDLDQYTPKFGYATFRDPKSYHFYNWVRGQAAEIGNFLREDEADATKNSSGVSGGN